MIVVGTVRARNVSYFSTIMDINYETKSSFPIFSPVEHPFPRSPPPSINVEDSKILP